MANRVYFWSDPPGETDATGVRAGKHARHAALGQYDAVTPVTGSAHLASIFRTAARANHPFDEAYFHTHGSPGCLQLGADMLLPGPRLDPFRGQGFEKTFSDNAKITFAACNLAEGPFGELFLVQVGQLFLSRGGGAVLGNTLLGIGDPVLTGDDNHPFGTWVTARVSPGGRVSLANHRYLDLKRIDQRLGLALLHLEDLEVRRMGERLAPAREALVKAMTFVTPPADPGAFENLALACDWLDRAEDELSVVEVAWRRLRRGGSPEDSTRREGPELAEARGDPPCPR
jgi:hypothetical protein